MMNKKTLAPIHILMLLITLALFAQQAAATEAAAGATADEPPAGLGYMAPVQEQVPGCPPVEGAGGPMAARIRFHDSVWAHNGARQAVGARQPQTRDTVTLAHFIRFHDALESRRAPAEEPVSMAERIRFHDRLWVDAPLLQVACAGGR